tara:strand:+ start:156 stop:413 length:258 start_codon:yes stop_codon:yes gene_type:complete
MESLELLKLWEQIKDEERSNSFHNVADLEDSEFVKITEAIYASEIASLFNSKDWISISIQVPEVQEWIMLYLWNRCEEIEAKQSA